MRKTLRTRRLRVRDGQRGNVLVATTFLDPQYGVVPCPAAPLLAAALSIEPAVVGRKTRVRLGPIYPAASSSDHDHFPTTATGLMFAASYLNGDGTTAGFALVAHRDDAIGAELAERTAARWTRVLRSRRLLMADIPLCPGGRRAIQLMENALQGGPRPVIMIGRPVTDRTTRRKLEQVGVVCTDHLDRIPADGQVIFPAHGVPLAVRAEAAARGLSVVDATCPLVAAAHENAAAYATRGDHVVVIGSADGAAFPVLATQAGEAAVIVQSIADVLALRGLDPDRVSFVVDPALPIEDVMPIVGALRRRYPNLRGHHFDVLCDHGSDRAQTIASITTTSEVMLIVTGHADDTDAQTALRAARGTSTRLRTVTHLADLDADILADATTIGMAATSTATPGLESGIVRALSGLGPLSVKRRRVRTTEDVNARPELADPENAGIKP